MNRYIRSVLTLLLFGVIYTASAQTASFTPATVLPGHPRLLMTNSDAAGIREELTRNRLLLKVHDAIITESRALIPAAPMQRIKTGRRLLDVSRECLRRIFFLSYAFRITGDKAFLERAEKEMLAVAAFSDWNPSHFLDVAEMTLAMSIGYDWLHALLSDTVKDIITTAIFDKGLRPSFDRENNGFLQSRNNWNQVCNTGMAFGAIAVYEKHPDTASFILNRAITSIKLPMELYHFDGDYPEGYNYWGYGTSFNVMFLSALQKITGTDFGLSASPGFLNTASYYLHMTGPTGKPFNYSDAGTGKSLQPAMFWFAGRTGDRSLLFTEKQELEGAGPGKLSHIRLLPAAIIWSKGLNTEDIQAPSRQSWFGRGKTPVALMRSSWTDRNALFAAIKGGSPSTSHAHMDIGSFIIEAQGERWALDPGMQDYESLESKGLNIFAKGANSQRWQVFRNTNYIHNTLTVNGSHQYVDGRATLTDFSEEKKYAIVDLSGVYQSLKKASRGITIQNGYTEVRDEIEAGKEAVSVRWAMLTGAQVSILTDSSALLELKGKKMYMLVRGVNTTLTTWSTQPPAAYDAPNDGTVLTGFEVTIAPGNKLAYSVYLLPEGTGNPAPAKDLARWK